MNLRLENVSYQYPKAHQYCLQNIHAEFMAGKVYQLLGNQGAGKSTLMALLAGLDQCSDGAIFFHQEKLGTKNCETYRAQHVACLLQEESLLRASAVANLQLVQRMNRQPNASKPSVLAVLEQVGFATDRTEIAVHKLSKKEQQLVRLAQLTIEQAPLLLIDEPETCFSELPLETVMATLAQQSRENQQCFIFTSQAKQLTRLVDELWGLNHGQLLFVKECMTDTIHPN